MQIKIEELFFLSIKKRIFVLNSHWVNKQSYDFQYHSGRHFEPQYPSEGSINMVKLLSFRFQ